MFNVFDVASYIISQLGEVTTMKLQKLTYYCQAWSLVWDDKPLFNEDFEAWANGPVCRELFERCKGVFSITNVDFFKKETSGKSFSGAETETMQSVLDFYGDKESHWLSNLAYLEQPWIKARGNYTESMYCGNVITKDDMREYYSRL